MNNLIKYSESKEFYPSLFETGLDYFDSMLGGGIPLNTGLVLAGQPGAGKSTLANQLASKMSDKGKKVLYVCGEEGADIIKGKFKRWNLSAENVYFLNKNATVDPRPDKYKLISNITVANILDAVKEIKADIVIVDSLQKLTVKGGDSASENLEAIKLIYNHIQKTRSFTLLAIGQATKAGVMAGSNKIGHELDGIMLLNKGIENHNNRVLALQKYRFGSIDTVKQLVMNSNGISERKPWVEPVEEIEPVNEYLIDSILVRQQLKKQSSFF